MAARWMAQKISKLKTQNVALAQVEYSKACYFTSKPEVPAYDHAMVKRVEPTKKTPRKVKYHPTPRATLVKTGATIGSWDRAGELTIVRRAK